MKICGVKSLESASILDGLADYVGFVHSGVGGGRSVALEAARALASSLSRSTPVLVVHGFEPSEAPKVAEGFGVLQFHGPLQPPEAAALQRALEPLGVSLAVVVEYTAGGWRPAEPCSYAEGLYREGVEVEYLLLDVAKGSGLRVPLGEAVKAAMCHPRVGLAGGLTHEAACRAASTGVWLLDVSSGVESGMPGVKDPLRVTLFIQEARRCSL